MYDKHAVWCQCALVFTIVLAVASFLSIQSMTLAVDVYWSVLLIQFALVRFILAEHAPVFGISTLTWFKLHPNTVVYTVILSWSVTRWNSTMALVHIPLLAGAILFKKSDLVLLLATVVRMCTSWDACLCALLVLMGLQKRRPSVRNKSIASWEQKRRFALMTSEILAQSVALWTLRCEHRFPHAMRWTPVFAATFGVLMAVVWCHFNVANTSVSHNAIIVENGHGMAASLKAANACPGCRKNLTALDMESSFSDSSDI